MQSFKDYIANKSLLEDADCTITFQDKKQEKYIFYVYQKDYKFDNISVIYAFIYRKIVNNKAVTNVLYIGESEDFGQRLDNHEKKSCPEIKKYWTHIAIMPVKDDEGERKRIESNLIAHYNPPCNKQHRTD